MTTGEITTSIIGALGLVAGIIGFFMARSASKKADEASATAAQAQVDVATATTAIASILARTNPEPVPHVKWNLRATGKGDQFAIVNVGNIEARDVTVQATDNTMAGLVRMLDRHVLPTFDKRRISSITSEDVEQWIARLASTPTQRGGKPLRPSTVKHAFIAANKVFRYALRHRLIGHNPATGTVLPRVQHNEKFAPQFLSGAEVEALAAALSGPAPDDLLVRVGAYCGLRAGELVALRAGDVDVHRERIRVQRTLVRTQEGWREDSPKSANSSRTVPMNKELAALRDYFMQNPHGDDLRAQLWPGRNYAGGGGRSTAPSASTTTASTADGSAPPPRQSGDPV